ncbi:MAG: Stage sporulation domain protein [Chloroflexi bacterium]|nr:Stage sporulation domain protein [Chloroflexota bacterium]
MLIRLVGGAIAGVIALGVLLVPSPAPVEAASSSCTGWTSSIVPPTSIRVLRSSTKRTQTVDFRLYVEKVMPAEWGSSHPAAALQAGAVAIKQYAWYYALAGHWRGGKDSAGQCYDVRDNSIDQVYDPTRKPASSHLAAVAATWSWSVRRSDILILTGYRPGIGACGDTATGYRLYQLEASRCASVNKWTAEQILRAYYSLAGKPAAIVVPGENDMTGDLRGDAAGVVTDPASGESTVRLFTTDPAASPAKLEAAAARLATTVADGSLLGRATTDVNADRRLDLVQLVAGTDDTVALEVMLATGTGFAPAKTWWTSAAGQFAPAELTLVADHFNTDFLGDAAIVVRAAATPELAARAAVWVARSTGTTFSAPVRRWGAERDLTAGAVVSGDFSGDGRADVAFLQPDGDPATATRVEVAVTKTNGYLLAPVTWLVEPAPIADLKVVVGDIDRTGRDDLFLLERGSADTVRVLAARGTGSAFSRRWVYTDAANPIPWSKVEPVAADLWKDGRTSLLLFLDLGTDDAGASLGTSVLRMRSYGTYLHAPSTWLTDPALDWATLDPY